jgi:hypothetical protein
MRALFVLTTSESKRLIGKAVARMELVQRAREKGKLLISHGSTNVYVIEEILGKEMASELWCRDHYVSGVLLRGNLCTILGTDKPPILILNKGKVEAPALTMAEILKGFDRNSAFIKGANCLDSEGNTAAFVAHPEGGTIGWAIGHLWAQGIPLITPVGLEKLIPSVKKAVSLCGQQTFDYCQGLKVGLVPMIGAQVVTEIEALKTLTGVEAFHIASGGQSGSEGAVTLVCEGEPASVRKAIDLVESIKGEPPLLPRKAICETCVLTSPAQPKDYKFEVPGKRCMFEGKKEEDLPLYLQNR